MHHEAHGLVPNQAIGVKRSSVANFLGRVTDPESAALEPIRESLFRAVMFRDGAKSTRAVASAVAARRRLDYHSRADGDDVPIRVRIGLGAGEPLGDGTALFGSTVDMTAHHSCQRFVNAARSQAQPDAKHAS
jgi:hypothetical protein